MQKQRKQDIATNSSHRSQYSIRNWVIILISFILLILFFAYRHHSSKETVRALPSVISGLVQSKDMPLFISALGTVTSTYSVTIKTQINGQLLQVLFKEGQIVKKGDLLAQIDPRPYEAELIQYQGQLTRDLALLKNAQIDLQRYQKLWSQDSVAKQTLDTQVYLVKQYEGNVKIDQGLLQSTQLNLTYCQIRAPMDGRVGLRLVDPGNYIQTSDVTGIGVITMLHPITIIFPIPEDNVPLVVEQMNTGKKLIVEAYDRSQKKLLSTGILTTIDNQIDPTTGTVKLKAHFENTDNRLYPNQFVNVQLLVNTIKNATTVPTAAIQYGANGTFVYVISPEDTVSSRIVTIGESVAGNTIILSGLSPGMRVVTEGADMITDNMKVTVFHSKQSINQRAAR